MLLSLRNKLGAHLNTKALVGSGLLWAWFDALFMSVFFMPSGQQGIFPEAGAIGTFIAGVPLYVTALCKSDAIQHAIMNKKAMLAIGFAGTAGSLLFIIAGFSASWMVLIAAAVLCGLYMGFAGIAWGAVYSSDGAQSATLYVAGGFAFAFVIDIPLLLMVPIASAIFFALLPLASFLLLRGLGRQACSFERDHPLPSPPSGTRRDLYAYLGMSAPVLGALILIMIGFGYMQHLTSFAPASSGPPVGGGVLIQAARGIVAVGVFVFAITAPKHTSLMYRIGLLAIVAGFSLMSLLNDTQAFWVPGMVVIAGYTTFDVLDWVVFSQAAHARSRYPLKTIAVMRLAVSVCYAAGALVGIALSRLSAAFAHVGNEAIFVGYLMTVAIVFLLSSKDTWELFVPNLGVRNVVHVEDRDDWFVEQCEAWGLTQREQEIIMLLAVGRTQPWIAENLQISENTVNTHVRHIYQKMGIRSRQELLDLVNEPPSHDSGEASA